MADLVARNSVQGQSSKPSGSSGEDAGWLNQKLSKWARSMLGELWAKACQAARSKRPESAAHWSGVWLQTVSFLLLKVFFVV